MNITNASAVIRGNADAPRLRGHITFRKRRSGVLVTVDISGLPSDSKSDFFALHIHEGESCGGRDFSNAGRHFDMTRSPHPEHSGDLPPLLSCRGRAYMSVLTDRFDIEDVVGRTVIIHSDPDDFRTQPSGDSGSRIGCGVIRRN